jgi:hypothetical protein
VAAAAAHTDLDTDLEADTVTVAAAAWCITCGGMPELVLTYERRNVLAHYGACRTHAHAVVDRALADLDHVDAELERARRAGRPYDDEPRRLEIVAETDADRAAHRRLDLDADRATRRGPLTT